MELISNISPPLLIHIPGWRKSLQIREGRHLGAHRATSTPAARD